MSEELIRELARLEGRRRGAGLATGAGGRMKTICNHHFIGRNGSACKHPVDPRVCSEYSARDTGAGCKYDQIVGSVCSHGHLDRRCEVCERDARIAELEAECERTRAEILRLEQESKDDVAANEMLLRRWEKTEAEIAALRADLAEAVALLRGCHPVHWVHAEPKKDLQRFAATVRYAEAWAQRVSTFLDTVPAPAEGEREEGGK